MANPWAPARAITVTTEMTSTSKYLANRYRLADLLGRGGMSDVYQAVDEWTGVTVAIKLVRSGDPALGRRMGQEARALARVDHPGLVRLIDTGLEDDQAYLVIELVNGPTLAECLRRGPLGAVRSAVLGARLADTLAHVHDQGIVHRDVKPSNIFLTDGGNSKLGDFGIARLLDSSTLTITGTTLGTAAYMAPEQLEDHEVGPSADIWSLGIVLLECLTGRRVYEGTAGEVVARRLAGPVPFPDQLPVPWKTLLSGMLDHRPDQRLDGAQVAALLSTSAFATPWDPPSTMEMGIVSPAVPHDLMALASGAGATSKMVLDDTPALLSAPVRANPRKFRWWLIASAVIAVGGLATGLGLGLRSSPTTPGHHAAGPTRVTRPRTPHRPTTAAGSSSSTTTSVPIPTTTTPNAPTALALLVRDLAVATESGVVGSDTAQSISGPAQQAVSDEAAGRANDAASDLQQAAQAIAGAVRNGSISPSEGATLEADLASLAADLGLSAAGSAPPTSPGSGNTGSGNTGSGNTGSGNTGSGGNGRHH